MKKKNVKWVLLIVLCLLLTPVTAFAASKITKITAQKDSSVVVVLNGEKYILKSGDKKVAPIFYDGEAYLPVGALSKAIGYPIAYDSSKKNVVIGTDNKASKVLLQKSDTSVLNDWANGFFTKADAQLNVFDDLNTPTDFKTGNCLVGSIAFSNKWIVFDTHGYDLLSGTIMAKGQHQNDTKFIIRFLKYDKENKKVGDEISSLLININEPTYFEAYIEGEQDVVIATNSFNPQYIVLGDLTLSNAEQ
jgi:hypothetical protein